MFKETTPMDIERLKQWIESDPYHRGTDPLFWMTGNGLLSFRVEDQKGTTMYIRLDKDDNLLRIHTQFAPENQVSKLRTVKSLILGFPKIECVARANSLDGYVFGSYSPDLILFMVRKFGFTPISDGDYRLLFEDGKHVRSFGPAETA